MAIQPNISLSVQGPTLSPAINAFENAMMNSQVRAQRQQQMAQAALVNPLIIEQQQIAAQTARDNRRIGNTAVTAIQLKPYLESGDLVGAEVFLTKNLTNIQARQAAGETIDANETIESLELLKAGNSEQLLQNANSVIDIANRKGLVRGNTRGNTQFGSQQTFKDEKGNLFFGTTKRNPNTGDVQSILAPVSGGEAMPEGRVSLVSSMGQTVKERSTTKIDETKKIEDIKANAKGKGAAVSAGVAQAVKAFEKIPLVRTAIGNYDEAIAAIDAGAETGNIDSRFPSIRQASKELDSVIKRLGLDVVGNTTFGALSESELEFALKAAAPDDMQPQELKEWFIAKRNAQKKILQGLDEMATYLGDGTKTIADWRNKQAVKSLASQDDSGQDAAPAAQSVIKFDAQGNIIQ